MAILGGSAQEHLERFIDDLIKSYPELQKFQFQWFDISDTSYTDNKYLLNAKNLRNLELLPSKLNELSERGKSWVHISGEGKLNNEIFLISISCNLESSGALATSINTSGLYLDVNGNHKINANVKLID